MRKLLFPAISALALIGAAGPLLIASSAAQTAMSTTVATPLLTAAQQTDYDTWAADQRSAYDAWPGDYKTYYWTLTLAQMHGWWRLTDVQRGQIMAMTPDQRVSTWTSIEGQLAPLRLLTLCC